MAIHMTMRTRSLSSASADDVPTAESNSRGDEAGIGDRTNEIKFMKATVCKVGAPPNSNAARNYRSLSQRTQTAELALNRPNKVQTVDTTASVTFDWNRILSAPASTVAFAAALRNDRAPDLLT